MLSIKAYTKGYIDFCNKKIENDIAAFNRLKAASPEFEQTFFNNLVLVLETIFIHRMRGQEGKDGNPLNEVRMLANSILTTQGKMNVDKTIKYSPEKAIIGIELEQKIEMNARSFEKLSKAYFKSIGEKFSG